MNLYKMNNYISFHTNYYFIIVNIRWLEVDDIHDDIKFLIFIQFVKHRTML
jgi:hypothetical protein